MLLAAFTADALIVTTIPLLGFIALGVLLAQSGDGRSVWAAGLMALVLSVLGGGVFVSPHGPGLGAASELLLAARASMLACFVCVAALTDALYHAAQEHRVGLLVALVLLVGVPLLTAFLAFDYLVGGSSAGSDRAVDSLFYQLDLVLVPLGSASLLACGAWAARRRAPARRTGYWPPPPDDRAGW